MITLPRHVRVHAHAAPAALRKGFEGLSALVREELGRDPLSGDLFLFTNRTRRRSKVLLFDGCASRDREMGGSAAVRPRWP